MKKIDWRTEAGYEDRKRFFQELRNLFEDLKFTADASDVLEEYNICFLDLDGDDFPRINLKPLSSDGDKQQEDVC